MNVYVNKKAGELFDLFISIFVACNLDYYCREVEKVNIRIDEEFRNTINEVISILGDDLPKYKVYFNELGIYSSLIDLNKIWELPNLDNYLDYIKVKNNYDIQKDILAYVDCYKDDYICTRDEEKVRLILNDNNLLIKFLSESKIPYEDKWNVLETLNNVEDFKENFIKLVKDYEKKYYSFFKNHKKDFDNYYIALESKINEKGADIEAPIMQLLDIKTVNSVYIIPSNFYAYTILQSVKNKDSSYIVIGKYINKIFEAKNRENSMEKYVSVFKNLGDLNRYKFIKLLSQGEKYGQEIADELKITSATVNYHANNLLIANLLRMERYENKTYYYLNKETLRNMIDFINKDLEL